MDETSGTNQSWEQFSLEVSQQQAECASAVLSEILGGFLVVERNYGDLFPDQLDQYDGPVRIYGYFPLEENARYRDRILAALKSCAVRSRPEFSALIAQDWATAWQERYHPIPVGQRLIVVPSWMENPQPDRLVLWIDPAMAFGSGTHPTTQLSLELLEACIEESLPARMIDVGCGSGILSIAGARLGVQQVLGVDTDADAVRVSRENAAANQVEGRTFFLQGSVTPIIQGAAPFQQASLVAVNIIAPILRALFAEGLSSLVSGGGRLVLSGILEEQAAEFRKLLEREGFRLADERQRGEWIGLVGSRGG